MRCLLMRQVTEYLHVKSFKRKYPDCPRRTVDMEERDFLMEMKIVNETQADLGLTAIPSSSVLDIMCQVSISIDFSCYSRLVNPDSDTGYLLCVESKFGSSQRCHP